MVRSKPLPPPPPIAAKLSMARRKAGFLALRRRVDGERMLKPGDRVQCTTHVGRRPKGAQGVVLELGVVRVLVEWDEPAGGQGGHETRWLPTSCLELLP